MSLKKSLFFKNLFFVFMSFVLNQNFIIASCSSCGCKHQTICTSHIMQSGKDLNVCKDLRYTWFECMVISAVIVVVVALCLDFKSILEQPLDKHVTYKTKQLAKEYTVNSKDDRRLSLTSNLEKKLVQERQWYSDVKESLEQSHDQDKEVKKDEDKEDRKEVKINLGCPCCGGK